MKVENLVLQERCLKRTVDCHGIGKQVKRSARLLEVPVHEFKIGDLAINSC